MGSNESVKRGPSSAGEKPSRRSSYRGVLCIGDPHLEGRRPGFRKDDYPQVILEKLEWSLNYAREHRLLPALLGDLFDKPRDNPTWMLNQLLYLFSDVECIGIYGNHDCADPVLNDNDSLMLLFTAGRIRRVTYESPWIGTMAGRPVVIGGSSYRRRIPSGYDYDPEKALEAERPSQLELDAESGRQAEPQSQPQPRPLVMWLAHHDISVPGYEEQGRFSPRELDGVDLVVNGHIHRRLDEVQAGDTRWVTPGNISRRSRSDAVRDHVPSVLRVDVTQDGFELDTVTVPHRPFDEVFHEAVLDPDVDTSESAFVSGLAELEARRTASGAGLMSFLDNNLEQFDDAVASEIRALAEEVTGHDKR